MSINEAILAQLNVTQGDIIDILDRDVREIFTTMLGVEVPQPLSEIDNVGAFKGSVTAMIGLAGGFNGLISIHASKKAAMGFASQMLGMEFEEVDDDVADAMGEIANMIGGSFKHHFVVNGHEVRLSIPSVISGEDYLISSGTNPDALTLLAHAGDDPFLVSVCLEPAE